MIRRDFMAGILAACAAPAIVRAESIMVVRRPLILPDLYVYPAIPKDVWNYTWQINPTDVPDDGRWHNVVRRQGDQTMSVWLKRPIWEAS